MTHPLDLATALVTEADGRYTGRFTPDYANMVGPFGGIIAATLLNGALKHPQRLGMPVALTVNFAGPVADAPFVVNATPVRTNRASQHWWLTLSQDDQIAVSATAVFASRHDTEGHTEAGPPAVPDADQVPALVTEGAGFLPVWLRRYEMRVARGGVSFDGQLRDSSETVLWTRDNPPRPLDFLSLTAFSDVFFPRSFVRRQQFKPAGTVSLTTLFHADADSLARQGDGLILGTARAQRFHRGYFDQSASLWSHDGELLATSTQLVYHKD